MPYRKIFLTKIQGAVLGSDETDYIEFCGIMSYNLSVIEYCIHVSSGIQMSKGLLLIYHCFHFEKNGKKIF